MQQSSSSELNWLDAFAAQATSTLVARCRAHVRRWLRAYRLDRAFEDVVQEVLVDILEGRVAWDPTHSTLLNRVCDVARYRIRDEKRSLRGRTMHVPISRPGDPRLLLDGESYDGASRQLEADLARAVELPEDPETALVRTQRRERAVRVGEELAAMARGDAEVESYLACLRAGITERAAVLAETGMTAETYHNARRRLQRLKERLPPELRLDVEDLR